MSRVRRRPHAFVLVLAVAAALAFAAASFGDSGLLGKQQQIYVVAASGGKVTRLTSGSRSSSAPSWSPRGTRIAFVQGGRVAVTDRDGHSHEILFGRLVSLDPPAWSRDGRLAFTELTSPEGRATIVVATPGSSSVRAIDSTRWGTGDTGRGPVWSPDGRWLAYCIQGPETSEQGGVRASGELKLAVTSAIGGVRRIVTTAPGSEFGPVWSPDSKTLLYDGEPVNKPRTNGAALKLVSASGGPSKTLVRLGQGGADASWSPSGRLVAFVGWLPSESRARLYVIRPDGSGLRRLTGEVLSETPAWSPDGRSIAYATSDGTIETIRPDGGGHSTVARLPGGEVGSLAWSPDGKTIAFDARKTPPES